MGAAEDQRPAPSTTLVTDGRRYSRSREFQSANVRIEVPDYSAPVFAEQSDRPRRSRTIAAQLIDLNETGLGVKTLDPLPVGSILRVGGELHSVDSCMTFEGRVRVAHCRSQEDGAFRVGLNFLDVKQQDLDCGHEPGFSLECG